MSTINGAPILRTDREAVGIDRSSRGTGYTLQYPEPFRALYDSPDTCPQELPLFFHRLRLDHVLLDGRSRGSNTSMTRALKGLDEGAAAERLGEP